MYELTLTGRTPKLTSDIKYELTLTASLLYNPCVMESCADVTICTNRTIAVMVLGKTLTRHLDKNLICAFVNTHKAR